MPDFPSQTGIPRCRVYASADQALTNSAQTTLQFDSERYDTATMHGTAITNLTGTVTKTASSATLAGSSTLFSSELSVGDAIMVPGTANEFAVVTAIASNTSLTVNQAFANSASGQTARKANEAVVCRLSGLYLITFCGTFAGSSAGTLRQWRGLVNGSTPIGAYGGGPPSTNLARFAFASPYFLNQYDFVTAQGYQDTGGSLNAIADPSNGPELSVVFLGT